MSLREQFYFHGDLATWYRAIYAFYGSPGLPVFELHASGLDKTSPPPPDYQPPPAGNVSITWNKTEPPHTEILCVDAESVLDKPITNLFVMYDETLWQAEGRAVYNHWNRIKRSLESQGLLIDPLAALKESVPIPKPAPGSGHDAWFDWFYRMRAAGYKMTLKDLARESGYTQKYIYEIHPAYARAHGLPPLRRKKRVKNR